MHFNKKEPIGGYNFHSLPQILKDVMKTSSIHPLGIGKNERIESKCTTGYLTKYVL